MQARPYLRDGIGHTIADLSSRKGVLFVAWHRFT